MNKDKLRKMVFNAQGTTAYTTVKEELRVLKTLEHPNIIWLHEIIDEPDGDIYLVTKYY